MRCSRCGTEGDSASLFCSSCGNPLTNTCTRCGQPLAQNDRFCKSCGTRVVNNPAPPLAPGTRPAKPPLVAQGERTPSADPFQIPVKNPTAPQSPNRTAALYPAAQGYRLTRARRSIAPRTIIPPAIVYEYKGIFPRFFAKVLDGFFMLVPLGLLVLIVSLAIGFPSGDQSLAPMLLLLLLVIFIIVYIALEGGGGTPGKRVMGMRIVDAGGNKPGLGKALVRNLLGIVDFLPFVYVLGVIMVASSPNKQRLGDRVAGTYVVGKV